ncbi:zinc finger MYM-type protein 1-like [Dreissena polymorpha]|uniref:zinc finger MYM-type protein 1-like n=1 Tax=Dreissena polymorpha TaxID=45954 RepID=UPI002264A7A8|nr:zinc finger MYM-type protein 1-like [Dreissena polymorpha]
MFKMSIPNQPRNFAFPKRTFGKKKPEQRSFQSCWFDSFTWLHYDESRDLAFCHLCMAAKKLGKIGNTKVDGSFISDGFSKWKAGTEKFRKHEKSECHKEAVERLVTLPATTRDVGEMLSAGHAKEKADNRKQLLQILRSIRFLARQGIALRGHDDDEGNFMQLLQHHGETDSSILAWLERKRDKFVAPDIQNEILQLMALRILRKVASDIKTNEFYTIMADETTDKSNREQVVVVFRHVDEDLNVHEDFVGFHQVNSIDATTLTSVIEDTLLRMNLSLSQCRGQCYDGASNMTGAKRGVATNILAKEERAVFTHCYGHALNLAVGDCVRQCKLLRDTMDTVHEVSKLIKYSPKRDSTLQTLKEEMSPDTPGFRVLCPTRWTVRAASLCSVLDNYTVLQTLWDTCYEQTKDSEIRSRIVGVRSQMESFDLFFGVHLGYIILRHTDNLSRTLQQKDMSASEGQAVASMTVETLTSKRSDDAYDKFWVDVNSQLDDVDVGEPVVPRRRKMPKRYDVGTGAHEYPATARDRYRQVYFEAFDLVIACIKDRFDQPGYKTYRSLQDLLVCCACGGDYATHLRSVMDFYRDDFNEQALTTQLETYQVAVRDKKVKTITDIVTFFRDLSPESRLFFSEVMRVLRHVLVMPATNATSERSFSGLRRLKTYLRTSMTQERLTHLMTLHVHRCTTDAMDLLDVANEFVSVNESRLTIFGKFS